MIIVIASLTLLVGLVTFAVMVWARRQRLRLDARVLGVGMVPDPPYLLLEALNPGTRTVRVEAAKIMLRDGRELGLPAKYFITPAVTAGSEDAVFELSDGQPGQVFIPVKDKLCPRLVQNGFAGQKLRLRPFLRFSTSKRRMTDTWWTLDVDTGELLPDSPGWFGRLVIRLRRSIQ